MRRSASWAAALLLGGALAACGGDEGQHGYSFAVLGCNRIAAGDVTPDNPSTANLAQLERSFEEIAGRRPVPEIVFFDGDLVLGLSADLTQLHDELTAWVAVYRNSALGRNRSIRLVAITGNHESLVKQSDDTEVSNPGAEAVWLDVMAPFIAGDNGPPAGGPDQLQTDQSRLTYSFDRNDAHFIVLNTDPYGAPATVPLHWLAGDLAAARAADLRQIFVIGHKPAFTPPIATESDSLDTYPEQRDIFWDLLNGAAATAYFTAHAHVYYRSQPSSTTQPNVVGTWQIVAGNGGSPVDAEWARHGDVPFYGYTLVNVGPGGRVKVRSFGRDFDAQNYLAPSTPQQYPTTIRDSADITIREEQRK